MKKTLVYFILIFLSVCNIGLFAQGPTIVLQPQNQSVFINETATFNLTATGDDPLVYQWFKDGSPISGANSNSYTTPPTVIDDNGSSFYCIVADSNGSTQSSNASLSVTFPNSRVVDGLQVLYNFKEGSGTNINDESGVGSALDLSITDNGGVNWTNEGLNIDDQVAIKSSSIVSKIYNACTASNEITFEAWLMSSNLTQRGNYARLFTISNNDIHERNYGLMQFEDTYLSQLRTTSTNLNGNPANVVSTSTNLMHYVYTRDAAGNVKVYIDGTLVSSETNLGDFSNWNNGYYIYLANSVSSNSLFWEGTYYLLSVYGKALNSSEVAQNYNFGVETDEVPFITQDPSDVSVLFGAPVTFEVKAVCTLPVTYQWQKNGTNISGANSSTYETTGNPDDNGSVYTCIITSAAGNTTSAGATLTVTVPDTRISTGQIVYYKLDQGSGNTINDVSGVGTAINMNISTPEVVEWTNSGLQINGSARIISDAAATKVYNECTSTNEISVEIWLIPANTTQTGPARILTNSLDNTKRNFTIGQDADEYIGSLRTDVDGNSNGKIVSSGTGTVSTNLTHLVYTRSDREVVKLFVNGVEQVKDETNFLGGFSTWDPDYRLAIGNELIDDNHFEGLIHTIAIFNRQLQREEVEHNYNIGVTDIPAPSDLTVTSANPGLLNLSWSDNSSNEDGFLIYRGVGNPTVFSLVDTVEENVATYEDQGVLEGESYVYYVEGFNLINTSEASNTDTGTVKIFPPNQLIVDASIVGSVSLTWTDNSDNEDGYVIERGEGNPTVFTQVGTVGPNVEGYLDNMVDEGTEYKYRVAAYIGEEMSDYSVVVTVTTLFSDINAPTNLVAHAPAVGQITLSWADNSDNEDGFLIERGLGEPVSYSVIDTVGENATSYTDNDVIDNIIYSYRVKAYNEFTVSGYSNVASVKSLITPIAAPTNLDATPDATRGVPVLTWTDNANNETGYKVERQNVTVIGSEFELIDSVAFNTTSYMDVKVEENTNYAYRVYAFNNDTTSDYSNIDIVPVTTSVQLSNEIPTEFSMAQNYPNPFNPSTSINFGLPEASKVTIRIFNLLGQELAVLLDRNIAPGNHQVLFDASNLTSGMYIYNISAVGINGGEFVQSKKMTLIK